MAQFHIALLRNSFNHSDVITVAAQYIWHEACLYQLVVNRLEEFKNHFVKKQMVMCDSSLSSSPLVPVTSTHPLD